MMETKNAHQSSQKNPQLLQKMAKSLEKDNRSKRIMEEQNMMEVHAKRGKLDHEPDNETYNAHEGGDGDMGSDLDILDMIKRITESREKYPLPKYFTNCTGGTLGNRMLRFNDIGPISHPLEFFVLIPLGLREFVQYHTVYSSGSKHYAFVSFDYYQLALNFLKKFNNLKVPGTELTYNLSWAPLKHDEHEYKRDEEYDHIFQTLGDEQIDESNGNQFDVPAENIEKDKHVDDPNTLEVKLVECDEHEHEHDDEHLSCTTEEEHVDESKGNQFDGPGENFENDKQGDVLKVENIAAGVKKLFSRLDEEAHSGKDASPWLWGTNEAPKNDPELEDDGVTKILFLDMVDPVIEEEEMARVFGRYGTCQVDLPPGKGCGTVTFDKRSSAKSAHEALSTLMETSGICTVYWCVEYEDYDYDWGLVQHPDPPCYVFGRMCPHYQKGQSPAN